MTIWVTGCTISSYEPATGSERIHDRESYSYGYWPHGWRKNSEDASPDVLCIETGQYGFMLDVDNIPHARFGLVDDGLGYQQALAAGVGRLNALQPAELAVEVQFGGRTYRAVTCTAGLDRDVKRLRSARLWESGRLVQHFDLLDLTFEDADGNRLGCYGVLDLVAWPGSLTLTAELTPSAVYRDGPTTGVSGNAHCVVDTPLEVPHSPALEPERLTVECWVNIPKKMNGNVYGWLLCKNENEWGQGNYGFMFRGGAAIAILNNAGGRDKQQMIGQRGRFPLGRWVPLALTYDGTTMRFYVDGISQGQKKVGQPRIPGAGPLRIGQRADGRFGVVSGIYDQVRVWNRALSAEEIAGHAANPEQLTSREGLTFEKAFDDGPAILPPVWTDAQLSVRLKTEEQDWHAETRVNGAWKEGEKHRVSVACSLPGAPVVDDSVSIRVTTGDAQTWPVTVAAGSNCFVAKVKGLERTWPTGYADIRNYDEFNITVENSREQRTRVPFLLDLSNPANITGLCPILCDEEGVPTGIPVQLSKNWHEPTLGAYLRAYALLPAEPGTSRYMLRVVYGFYGALPSASHAQLSLVGYGNNGRWDQLAIGCWGETFCLDMDMSCTQQAITDVRCLLVRNGANGTKWSWTDGGWGGDWLSVSGDTGEKLYFSRMKTAYLAQGPCLTDVRYHGGYGPRHEVDLQATVHTLRTDDCARTFHRLGYTFREALPAERGWLFKMGGGGGLVTPQIAYGNGEGPIAVRDVPNGLKSGHRFVDRLTLTGDGPWWVAFPGADPNVRGRAWGTGSRALIIRSYQASFGGHTVEHPTISMPVNKVQRDGRLDLDLLLVPPVGVKTFQPGDHVEMDLQWITLPRVADDYYGPNEAFRQHLAAHPRSWETVYREAKGNDLGLKVTGGKVTHRYPIVIRAEAPEVAVEITGGVGFIPIWFGGLATASGYALFQAVGDQLVPLDQSVHGNDFWQTDYDADTNTYSMSFNLPLDGMDSSKWVLKR